MAGHKGIPVWAEGRHEAAAVLMGRWAQDAQLTQQLGSQCLSRSQDLLVLQLQVLSQLSVWLLMKDSSSFHGSLSSSKSVKDKGYQLLRAWTPSTFTFSSSSQLPQFQKTQGDFRSPKSSAVSRDFFISCYHCFQFHPHNKALISSKEYGGSAFLLNCNWAAKMIKN